jgi:phospholipid/cholesterol/gamma-HCH transport system permease protein
MGVTITRMHQARSVVWPLTLIQIYRAGISLLPMMSFLAFALGFVIIGQTVSLLNRVGAEGYTGTVMVTVVVRELGPIIAALVVLTRIGTATVVELATARAMNEVEGLEALGIDPIHYLVTPRVLGLAVSTFCLTIYFIAGTLFSGYLFAFVQDISIRPMDYLTELANAMRPIDFLLMSLKTFAFGSIVALATCYEGLAKPLRLEEVAQTTSRAVVDCMIGWALVDGLFLTIYLFN